MEIEDITANGFIDAKYLVSELPDDFFDDDISERVKSDPLTLVMKDRVIAQGEMSARFGYVDFQKQEINVGPRDYGQTLYYIEPDFHPCDVVMEYYDRFMAGEELKFPDVPIAQPVVPQNKRYKSDEEYRLEGSFMNRSCYLANPKKGQFEILGAAGEFVTPRGDLGTTKYVDVPNGSLVFQSYVDTLLEDDRIAHCVRLGMQFNPFHPMAKEKIRDFEWLDEYRCRGTYLYRENVVGFVFDLQSPYYRVHSDQWIPNMGLPGGFYEVYDIVGDKPFAHLLRYRAVKNDIEPMVIEPIFRTSEKQDMDPVYSVLGPWGGQVVRGRGDVTYSPSTTRSFSFEDFDDNGAMSLYEDITDRCELDRKKGNLVFTPDPKSLGPSGKDVNRLGSKYVFPLIPSSGKVFKAERNKRMGKPVDALTTSILSSEDVFLRLSLYSSMEYMFRAFLRRPRLINQKKGHPFYYFCEMKDIHYRSFPVNTWGSISYGLKCFPLLDLLGMDRRHHEYIPMIVNPPSKKKEFFNRFASNDYDFNIDEVMDNFGDLLKEDNEDE